MLGNALGYMATTCMVLLVGGCLYESGSFRTDVAAAAAQIAPRREDYDDELTKDLRSSTGQAVLALMEKSTALVNGGDVDQAATNLERGLHIEPRNAFLYSRLAALRMLQERYEEAESLAAKSNSIASRNARLLESNWRLIAESRAQRGDDAGAKQANQRADQLREFIDK